VSVGADLRVGPVPSAYARHVTVHMLNIQAHTQVRPYNRAPS
jgi:hypothetical protein